MKKAKFIRNVFMAVLVVLTAVVCVSCDALLENGRRGNITINLPPISSSARAISADKINDLKGDIASYRVIVNANGQRTEKSGGGGRYSFEVPVGAKIEITVECLNSSGDVIARAVKTHTVKSGTNNISINLSRDGELVGAGGTPSDGGGGEVVPPTNPPQENPFNIDITLDGVSIGSVQNKLNGANITSDVQDLLAIQNEVNNKRYAWNTGTITANSTSPTVEIKPYCTVTAVKLTLSTETIASSSSTGAELPNYYKSDFQGHKDVPAWYDIGYKLPTEDNTTFKDPNTNVQTNNVNFYGNWGQSLNYGYCREVDEELAGMTLKAVVFVKDVTLEVKHFDVSGSGYQNRTSSDITAPSDFPTYIPLGTTISSSGKGSTKNVITITFPGGEGVQYEFSFAPSVTSSGCYISTTDDNSFYDGNEDDITSYIVEGIDEYGSIYLAFYWKIRI